MHTKSFRCFFALHLSLLSLSFSLFYCCARHTRTKIFSLSTRIIIIHTYTEKRKKLKEKEYDNFFLLSLMEWNKKKTEMERKINVNGRHHGLVMKKPGFSFLIKILKCPVRKKGFNFLYVLVVLCNSLKILLIFCLSLLSQVLQLK